MASSTIAPDALGSSPLGENETSKMPVIIWAILSWNTLLIIFSIILAITVFNFSADLSSVDQSATLLVDNLVRLGRPVVVFVAFLALLPGIVALISSLIILVRIGSPQPARISNTSRMLLMALYLFGGVMMLALLAHQWGLYQVFERIVDGVMSNATLVLGFPIAYAVYWLAGRLGENTRLRNILETTSLALAGLTLIALAISSDILTGFNYVLSTYSDPLTWVLTITAIVFFGLMLALLRLGAYFGESPQERTAWQGWIMLSPNIIGFTLFFAGPLLLSLYLSFTDSSVGQIPDFIGFGNYAEILSLEIQTADVEGTAQSALSFGYGVLTEFDLGGTRYVLGAKDTVFWLSLRNTLLFCLLLIPLAVIPALALSLVLNSKLPGMKFFRAIYFLPSVAAVVGTALVWRWLYTPNIGYFYNIGRDVLVFIGDFVRSINATFGLSIAEPAATSIEWLTDPNIVLISMVLLSAWGVVGYNTVLFLAGLQGIPGVLYEAAQIDGANRWGQFRNVTLPMLAPTTFFVLITTIVTGLQVFNEPYTLFPAQPIPINATTSVYYLYRRGFFFFEFGYASAIAWLLFIIIFVITLLQFRAQRDGAYES
ncbi:MAG: hypothetical protein CL607_12500 [Anaerolineaceae bacterium]|nr:hypothetical protein [Anaerolineaceae bacterium]